MAAGKPTIVLKHAGPGEIADDETSWLVDATRGVDRAVAHLAEGLIHLSRRPEQLALMGQSAKLRIEERFSWDAYICFMRNLYIEGAAELR